MGRWFESILFHNPRKGPISGTGSFGLSAWKDRHMAKVKVHYSLARMNDDVGAKDVN